MQFLLHKITIFSYEIVLKIRHPYGDFQAVFNALSYSFEICDKIDIHVVSFNLFSMHCHTVLKYVIKLCILYLIMIIVANK